MNILIVASFTRAHHFGGRERHVHDLATGLAARGHAVHVATSALPLSARPALEFPGTTYHFAAASLRPRLYTPGFFRRTNTWLRALVEAHGIDVNINENSASECVYHDLPVPTLLVLHGTPLNEIRSALSSPKAKLPLTLVNQARSAQFVGRQLKRAAAVVAVSESLARDVMQQYHAPASGRIWVIPNGVDPQRYFPRPAARAGGPLRILSVGYVIRQKGFFAALEALALLRLRGQGFQWQVVGDGPDLAALRARATALGIADAIEFLGRLPQERMPAVYQEADLLLFPTQRHEGLPYVVLEAMASGLAVVSTPMGGIQDALRPGENGVLLPDRPSEATIAGHLEQCLAKPKWLQTLRQGARATVEREFSLAGMLSHFEALMGELAAGGQGSAEANLDPH